jgi:hypothetical protein
MKGLAVWRLVEQFEDGALRYRRCSSTAARVRR